MLNDTFLVFFSSRWFNIHCRSQEEEDDDDKDAFTVNVVEKKPQMMENALMIV